MITYVTSPLAQTVIRVALAVMYVLSLIALASTWTKIKKAGDLSKVLESVARRKLALLGLEVGNLGPSLPRRVVAWFRCYRYIIVGYAALTMLVAAYWFIDEPPLGLGIILLSSMIYVSTKYLLSAHIVASKEVEVIGDGEVSKVMMRVSSDLSSANLAACSDISVASSVIDGVPCVQPALKDVTLEYLVASPTGEISDYVITDVYVPLAISRRVETVKIEKAVKYSPRPKKVFLSTAKVTRRIRAGIEEPVADHARPYVPGDDLRLLIPKSVLSVSGPKVKVLPASSEVREYSGIGGVAVIVTNYVKSYAAGATQLKLVIKYLRDEGVSEVVIGSKRLSIEELTSRLSRFPYDLPLTESFKMLEYVSTAVVPPDADVGLTKYVKEGLYVILLKPARDNLFSLVSPELRKVYEEWFSRTESNFRELLDGLRKRGAVVKVVSIHDIAV